MNLPAKIQNINTRRPNPAKIGSYIPAHSVDAEIAILGAMIIGKNVIPKVLDLLNTEHLYSEKHKIIFNAVNSVFDKTRTVDLVSLKEELIYLGKLDFIGGVQYLTEILRKTPSYANVEQYCLIVYEKFLKRKVSEIAYNSHNEAVDDSQNISDIIPKYINELNNIASTRKRKTPEEDAIEYMDYYHKVKNGEIVFYPTGITKLDDLIDGFSPGDLVVIGARPSVGKTALGVTISQHQYFKKHIPQHHISIEMSSVKYVNRFVSQMTKVSIRKIKSGDCTPVEEARIQAFLKDFSKSKIFIDSEIEDIDDIVNSIRLRQIFDKTEVVYIDNFQLITAKGKFQTETDMYSVISKKLRKLAKELNIVIVSLNQLNRNLNQRSKKQPIASDLRNTGSLEQDAALIIMIDRPEVENREKFDDDTDAKGLADIVIVKNRDGETGIVRVEYIGEFAKFQSYNPNSIPYFDNTP